MRMITSYRHHGKDQPDSLQCCKNHSWAHTVLWVKWGVGSHPPQGPAELHRVQCGPGQGEVMGVWGSVQRCLLCFSLDGLSEKLSQCNEQISCPANSTRKLCQGKNKSWSSLRIQPGAVRGSCRGWLPPWGLCHSRTALGWRRKALNWS